MKIVVIEALGLHLGYLGCYGNDWVATPNLDRLASQGVVFDWHIADNPGCTAKPWSERSVGTGVHTFHSVAGSNCVRTVEPSVVRCPALATFCEDVVRNSGLSDKWLWIEGPSLLPPWRLEHDLLDVYFDEDDIEEGLEPWIDPPAGRVNHTEADVLRVQSTYAAAVTVFDAQLGALFEKLDKLGEDVLVCVTAHSGLPLGEHGVMGTSQLCLHDEMVHVPLLMRLPGGANAGARISALTQPVDLLPTFLAALGEPQLPLHGHDLWPLLRGEVESVRPYAAAGMHVGDEQAWLLRTPELALHLPIRGEPTRRLQLFVKPDDRWEVNDLYQQQVEAAEALESALRAFADRCRCAGPVEYPPVAH